MKRIITYDIKEGNDYKPLYALLEELNGEMLTESTYLIDTVLSMDEIVAKIQGVTYSNDNIYFVSVDTEHALLINKIR